MQYSVLLISSLSRLAGNSKLTGKMFKLFASLKEARRLLRLFKWSIEYKRIRQIIEKRP